MSDKYPSFMTENIQLYSWIYIDMQFLIYFLLVYFEWIDFPVFINWTNPFPILESLGVILHCMRRLIMFICC